MAAGFPVVRLEQSENPDEFRLYAEVESMTTRIIKQIRDAEDSQARSILLSAYAAGEAGIPFETFIQYLTEGSI